MRTQKGFTLIELLGVIALIALLMAILLPALERVKEQARDILCRSNLNQYGLAARMYLDDNEGSFPYARTWLHKDDRGVSGACQSFFRKKKKYLPELQNLLMENFHIRTVSKTGKLNWEKYKLLIGTSMNDLLS